MSPRGWLVFPFALIACTCEPEAMDATATATDEERLEDQPPEEDEALTGVFETRYDLLLHTERARVFDGASPLIDLGADAGAMYTLGGWRTRTGDTHVFGETRALLIPGVTGEVLLPSDTDEAQTLRVRMRAFGDGRATLYVNGETVKHARLPRDGSFAIVDAPLSAGLLRAGENTFQVRVSEVGHDEGVRAGVALEWMRLDPPDAVIEEEHAFARVTREDGVVRLNEGLSMAWAFDAWPAAKLVLESEGRARVTWQTHQETRELGVSEGGTARFAVPEGFGELRVHAEDALSLRALRVETPSAAIEARQAPAPTNVIVFLVDTVRADKLRPFNPESRVETPGLDAWARRTAVFQQGHTQENWTKPSVATLLTGLLPWQHTATSGEAVLPNSVEMLSERLGDAGFQTGAFICNGYVSDKFGFEQGWGSFRNYIREGRRTQARFVAADVLEWLDARDEEQPFFLYVHTIDPHVPYMPPESTLALYDPDPYEGPIDFGRDRELLEKIKSGSLRTSARDRVRLEALYDGEITYHDVHFGSILEGLERRGLDDNTMVVFTADHGEEFFDHESCGHGHSLYEELLHVPMMIRVPGRTDARVDVAEPVGLVDVVPTVLEALGHEVPADLPGRSLLSLIEGRSTDAPTPVVSGFMEGWRSVVVGHYKLIQRTHRRVMAYDLEQDPGELEDIAETRPLLVRYLRAMLGLRLAGRTRPRHQAQRTEIDPETNSSSASSVTSGHERPD